MFGEDIFLPYRLAVIAEEKEFTTLSIVGNYCTKNDGPFKEGEIYFGGRKPSKEDNRIIAPLYDQIVKWFIEKHNLNVSTSFKMNIKKWDYIVYDMNLNGPEYVKYYKQYKYKYQNRQFNTQQDALNSAIEEALNLI